MNAFAKLKALLMSKPGSTSATNDNTSFDGCTSERRATGEAFREIFTPCHGAQEHSIFQPISEDGVSITKNEEWFRDSEGMRVIAKKGFVVTCSGDVVPSEQIKARCSACGGFDSIVARCAQCNITLCRIHSYTFDSPSGPLVLCRNHYRRAIENFDVWAAHDLQTNTTRRKS